MFIVNLTFPLLFPHTPTFGFGKHGTAVQELPLGIECNGSGETRGGHRGGQVLLIDIVLWGADKRPIDDLLRLSENVPTEIHSSTTDSCTVRSGLDASVRLRVPVFGLIKLLTALSAGSRGITSPPVSFTSKLISLAVTA